MISASLVDVDVYEVIVERDVETTHRVTLSPDYHRKLCGGTITQEWVIVQSFRFLLEREPNTAIESEFNLEDIGGYFPEYEEALKSRLGTG